MYRLPGNFGLWQCRECELVRLSPRPVVSEVGYYYPSDEYSAYEAPLRINDPERQGSASVVDRVRSWIRNSVLHSFGYPFQLSGVQRLAQPLLKRTFLQRSTFGWGNRLPSFVEKGRLLDIGCSTGAFLGLAKSLGWNADGIEMSASAAEVAKNTFGVEVFVGDLSEFESEPDTYNYINISHVLEHIYDPVAFLNRVRELLKSDGTIYIEVPNFESFGRRESNQYWFGWETPRHVQMFSPSTLKAALNAAGLEVKSLETQIGDFWAMDYTYKIEEKVGHQLERRPATGSEVEAFQNKYRREALRELRRDKLSGDVIYCWAIKSSGAEGR
jgi:2-polyprenyl-3-methyl-5-hydroxy-6-metoxy-1,4-benzoquinol methylase